MSGPSLLDPTFQRRLTGLQLAARARSSELSRGQRIGARLGAGLEFRQHRPYRAGDDLRFVDFHAYARTDQLLVKEFSELHDVRVHLLLDCSASMAFGSGRKLLFAKQLAAALGYIGLAHLDQVVVTPFDEAMGARSRPLRGARQMVALLHHLQQLRGAGRTDTQRAFREFAARERAGAVVIVLTDAYDFTGLLPAIDLLRHARHQVRLIRVHDPDELTELASGAHELVDCETGEAHRHAVNPEAIRQVMQRAATLFAELALGLRERRVPNVTLAVGTPFDAGLLAVLQRNGLLS